MQTRRESCRSQMDANGATGLPTVLRKPSISTPKTEGRWRDSIAIEETIQNTGVKVDVNIAAGA